MKIARVAHNLMKMLVCFSGLALLTGQVLGQSQPAPHIPEVRQVEQIQRPDFAITNADFVGSGILAYNPNGNYLAVVSGKSIQIYDTHSGDRRTVDLIRTLNGHAEQILGLAFSDTNTLVSVSLDQTVKIWDVATGKVIHSAKMQVAKKFEFALAPRPESLVADTSFGKARLWNYQTGEVLETFEPGDSWASTVAFTPNGKSLVIGTEKGVLRVMDVATRTVTRIVDMDSPILSLATSAEHIVLGYSDGSVAVLNLGDQSSAPEIKKQRGAISALAFSPNGEQFASASADHSVKVWNAGTLKPLCSLEGHGATVVAVAFCPDGKRIVSMDTEGVVNFWAVPKQ
jgi:WD40 repeat protein